MHREGPLRPLTAVFLSLFTALFYVHRKITQWKPKAWRGKGDRRVAQLLTRRVRGNCVTLVCGDKMVVEKRSPEDDPSVSERGKSLRCTT
jgi:hypothetical protein